MYLFLLLILLILLLQLSLIMTKVDLTAPCNVYLMIYVMACTFAALNYKQWEFDMGFNTFAILLIGAVIFFCVSLVIRPNETARIQSKEKISEINISKIFVIAMCVLDFVMILLTYIELCRLLMGSVFTTDIFTLFYRYRVFAVVNSEYNLPGYIVYVSKVPEVASYILAYSYINNIFISKTNARKYRYYIWPTIFEIARILESGARLGVINVLIGIFVCAYGFFWRDKGASSNIKKIFKYTGFALLGMILFYYMAIVLGRSVESFSIVEYISVYTGAPLRNLDLFLSDNVLKSEIFGEETFYYLNHSLGKRGIIKVPNNYTVHMETMRANGHYLGNTYTAFRRWFKDFGYSGVFILQFGFASFYNILYKKITDSFYQRSIMTYFYLYYSFPLFLHFFDDMLYRNIFSFASIIYIFLFFVFYKLLIRNKIRLRLRR